MALEQNTKNTVIVKIALQKQPHTHFPQCTTVKLMYDRIYMSSLNCPYLSLDKENTFFNMRNWVWEKYPAKTTLYKNYRHDVSFDSEANQG